MNGIGDTWRSPRTTGVAPGPFSRLIEVAAKTAHIESEFRLIEERQRLFERDVEKMQQALEVLIKKLETQVPQPVVDAITEQLNAFRNEVCDLIHQAVRSALAQELDGALNPLREQLGKHEARLNQLEDDCRSRETPHSGKQEKAK